MALVPKLPHLSVLALALAPTTCNGDSTHAEPVLLTRVLEASPVGSRIAIGVSDRSVRVIDAATGKAEHRFLCEGGEAEQLVFSPDGRRLAVAVREKPPFEYSSRVEWIVYDLASTAPGYITRLGLTVGSGFGEFSADGKRLLLGSEGSPTRVVDAVTGDEVFELRAEGFSIICGAWAEATQQIVTGGDDGKIRSWNARTGEPLLPERDVGERAECVVVSPDGRKLLSGANRAMATIWSLPELVLERQFEAEDSTFMEDLIVSADWSGDGERILLTTGTWHTVECRDREGRLLWMEDFHGGDENPLLASFHPSGRYAASWRVNSGFARVFDVETGECRLDLMQRGKRSGPVAWTGDGKRFVHEGPEGLEVIDPGTFSIALRLQPTLSGIRRIVAKP